MSALFVYRHLVLSDMCIFLFCLGFPVRVTTKQCGKRETPPKGSQEGKDEITLNEFSISALDMFKCLVELVEDSVPL